MNASGLAFWILVLAVVCLALLALGLLSAVLYVSGAEAERERRREGCD